jgi:hypothetical protein
MACYEVSNLAGCREEPEGFGLQDRVNCQRLVQRDVRRRLGVEDANADVGVPGVTVWIPAKVWQRWLSRPDRPREKTPFARPICTPDGGRLHCA